MIPIKNVNEKSLITLPPNKKSDAAARNVVPEVIMVRLKHLLMAAFMISLKVPRTPNLRSSRIRSKMTMVSLMEKPITVKIAATIGAFNSRPVMKNHPKVMRIS